MDLSQRVFEVKRGAETKMVDAWGKEVSQKAREKAQSAAETGQAAAARSRKSAEVDMDDFESVPYYQALRQSGVTTVEEVEAIDDFTEIPGIGDARAAEIKAHVEKTRAAREQQKKSTKKSE